MKLSALVALTLSASLPAAEYTLPASNQGDWEPGVDVGVPGGINQYRPGGASQRTNLIDVTQAPYNADNTGVSDCAVAIETALAAAVSGDVVYLPAGTYRLNDEISLLHGMDNITLRGAGVDQTTLDVRSSFGIDGVGFGAFDVTATTLSGTKTKGTSVLTVGDSSALAVGELVQLEIEDETDNTRIQAGAFPRLRWDETLPAMQSFHRVTAIASGTSITIDPPLPVDCTNASVSVIIQASGLTNRLELFGIEDMTITGANSGGTTTSLMRLWMMDRSWIYNVKAVQAAGYLLFLTYSHKLEIRKCVIGERFGGGSNGAGILLALATSALIEDNIIYDVAPLFEFWTTTINNVVAHNMLAEPDGHAFVYHRSGGCLNLVEANVAASHKSDGYFGTNSNNTVSRNFLHGTEGGVATLNPIELKRGSYGFVNVGNVLGWDGIKSGTIRYGYPNVGNESTNGGTAEWSTGDFWADWKKTGTLTTRTSDTVADITVSTVGDLSAANYGPTSGSSNGPWIRWAGGERYKTPVTNVAGSVVTFGEGSFDGGDVWPSETTAVTISAGQPGFQELDLDVQNSTINAHNYVSDAAGTGALSGSISPDTLPNSFAYSAQPSWWNDDGFSGTWPPVNPDSPTFSLSIIPAGARYLGATAPGNLTTDTLTIGP